MRNLWHDGSPTDSLGKPFGNTREKTGGIERRKAPLRWDAAPPRPPQTAIAMGCRPTAPPRRPSGADARPGDAGAHPNSADARPNDAGTLLRARMRA